MAAKRQRYGPNSEQVEAYLRRVAALEADDWASLELMLTDSTTLTDGGENAIDRARTTASRRGLLSEVDAAGRTARDMMNTILDASAGLGGVPGRASTRVGPDDPARIGAPRYAGVIALRSAATSGATLLVVRPFLDEGEFIEAWPIPIIDPRSLPDHVHVPGIGATGF